jgi:hypothetical protein
MDRYCRSEKIYIAAFSDYNALVESTKKNAVPENNWTGTVIYARRRK